MTDLDALEKLAREATAEAGDYWFSPALAESDAPIYSPPNARRYIAAASPDVVLRLVAVAKLGDDAVDALTAGLAHTLDKFQGKETDDSRDILAIRDAMRSALAALKESA